MRKEEKRCIRCGKPLETELDFKTGICAGCWMLSDYKSKREKREWDRGNWSY